jgi:hypothetical protein
VLCGVASPSRAQDATEPPHERAERLFLEGRAALKQADYDAACDKLAESERLEQAVGTLLNWGVCLEKKQQRAAAWVAYRDALELARESDSAGPQRFARQRLAELEADLVKLTLVPPHSPPAGLVITLDGVAVAVERWQRPVAVELGAHVIEAGAPGRSRWSQTVDALEGGTERVVVVESPLLLADAASPPHAAQPLGAQPFAAQPLAPQPEKPSVFHARWVVPTAIAVVGLAATAYFGARAASAWQTRQVHCSGGDCDATAVDASQRAARFARLADVSGVVTATAAVTSVCLGVGWARERSAAAGTPRAQWTPVVRVGGSF